jgi:phosphatidylglycerol phospholipase C
MVWTVNDPLQMMEAVRWKVAVILTDKPKVWLELREQLIGAYTSLDGTPYPARNPY